MSMESEHNEARLEKMNQEAYAIIYDLQTKIAYMAATNVKLQAELIRQCAKYKELKSQAKKAGLKIDKKKIKKAVKNAMNSPLDPASNNMVSYLNNLPQAVEQSEPAEYVFQIPANLIQMIMNACNNNNGQQNPTS